MKWSGRTHKGGARGSSPGKIFLMVLAGAFWCILSNILMNLKIDILIETITKINIGTGI